MNKKEDKKIYSKYDTQEVVFSFITYNKSSFKYLKPLSESLKANIDNIKSFVGRNITSPYVSPSRTFF